MKIEKPTKILLRRRTAIGDVIMSTGVARELRNKYGRDAIINVATDEIAAYRNNPNIDGIIPLSTLTGEHILESDVYINLDDAYELNPKNHYVDSYFYRAFGAQFASPLGMDRSVELFPDTDDCATVDEDLKRIGDKFIVVHMRNWYWAQKNIDINVWFAVFEQLFNKRTDFKIVCVGGNTDHHADHPLFVDLRGKYNNQQLKYLCDHARAFVGIDSGPFQCAAASNTHIIALLTHLKPERILPYRNGELGYNCTAITTRESCGGCNDKQTRPIRQIICEHGDNRCTANFDADAIAAAVLKQLED